MTHYDPGDYKRPTLDEMMRSSYEEWHPWRKEYEEMKQRIAALEAELAAEREGDNWKKHAAEAMAGGTCPVCFATDEEGHKSGCPWGKAEAERDALRAELKWSVDAMDTLLSLLRSRVVGEPVPGGIEIICTGDEQKNMSDDVKGALDDLEYALNKASAALAQGEKG